MTHVILLRMLHGMGCDGLFDFTHHWPGRGPSAQEGFVPMMHPLFRSFSKGQRLCPLAICRLDPRGLFSRNAQNAFDLHGTKATVFSLPTPLGKQCLPREWTSKIEILLSSMHVEELLRERRKERARHRRCPARVDSPNHARQNLAKIHVIDGIQVTFGFLHLFRRQARPWNPLRKVRIERKR